MPVPPAIEEMIDSETIARRVAGLGREIAEALPPEARARGIVVVGTLKGAVVFMADLIRALGHNGVSVQVDFFRLASYGASTTSSGEVVLETDLSMDLAGRHVLLVDDIVDTGRTMAFALEHLRARGPASLRSVVFLDKPSRRVVDVRVDHVGIEIPDRFVVGYGTDFAEDYRELDYIGVLTS